MNRRSFFGFLLCLPFVQYVKKPMRYWKIGRTSRTFHMPDKLWKSNNGEIRLKNWQAMMEHIKLRQWHEAAKYRERVGCFDERGPV